MSDGKLLSGHKHDECCVFLFSLIWLRFLKAWLEMVVTNDQMWGVWMVQSVGPLTLGFGSGQDLRVMGSSRVGLRTQEEVGLRCSLCPPSSLSKINTSSKKLSNAFFCGFGDDAPSPLRSLK